MDIETIHFEAEGLTAHVLPDTHGSFWVCITRTECSDAIYESRGWDTVEQATEDAMVMVKAGFPITF